MRHLDIRDLWLQKEVREGRLVVEKVPGDKNAADLMTKTLTIKEIEDRLRGMNIRMEGRRIIKEISRVEKRIAVEFDVSELFSCPRTVELAAKQGLRAGYSVDKKWVDGVSGKAWDLTRQEDKVAFGRLRNRRRSKLLVVSPPCTKLSILQNLRKGGVPMAEWEEAVDLANFGVEACGDQLEDGGYFILEHPVTSRIWGLDSTRKLVNRPGVVVVDLDQCVFGLQGEDKEG
jgi:hypothetical protein